MTAALFPDFDVRPGFEGRVFDVRLGNPSPVHAVYVRRRLLVALIVLGLILAIGVSARAVLADRGGVPASTPAIRSANIVEAAAAASPPAAEAVAAAAVAAAPAAVPAAGIPYIVQPGDTLWSLAERFHATTALSSYVDDLVDANGGATIQAGQLITLP